MTPNPCETVGLQLKPYRQCICLTRLHLSQALHPLLDAEYLLDVVSNLMREYVCLCELTRCAETLLQFVVETKVDVHLLVFGTVKRSSCGLGETTSGLSNI